MHRVLPCLLSCVQQHSHDVLFCSRVLFCYWCSSLRGEVVRRHARRLRMLNTRGQRHGDRLQVYLCCGLLVWQRCEENLTHVQYELHIHQFTSSNFSSPLLLSFCNELFLLSCTPCLFVTSSLSFVHGTASMTSVKLPDQSPSPRTCLMEKRH